MLLRRDGKSPAAIAAFVLLSLFAGAGSWFLIFATAWSGQLRDVIFGVAIVGIVPATITGVIGRGVLGRSLPRFVATAFAWPMAGWGIGCLFAAMEEGWGLMIWTGIGAAMLAAALLGTLIADWMRRYSIAS